MGPGFWKKNRLQSGKEIDAALDQNIPHNAKTIDRTVGQVGVVSHKSTDLRLKSYQSMARVYWIGMRFVKTLVAYEGEVRRDRQKQATYHLHWALEGNEVSRVLQWFVPDELTLQQEETLQRVIDDGKLLGVDVQILRIPD